MDHSDDSVKDEVASQQAGSASSVDGLGQGVRQSGGWSQDGSVGQSGPGQSGGAMPSSSGYIGHDVNQARFASSAYDGGSAQEWISSSQPGGNDGIGGQTFGRENPSATINQVPRPIPMQNQPVFSRPVNQASSSMGSVPMFNQFVNQGFAQPQPQQQPMVQYMPQYVPQPTRLETFKAHNVEKTVGKFDGQFGPGWTTWKLGVEDHARSRQLLKFFKTDITNITNDPAIKEADAAIMGGLCELQSCKHARKRILACSTVFEAWNAMIKFYESRVEEEQVRLQTKLLSFTMQEKDDVMVKFEEMRTLREELLESGLTIANPVFTSKVLGSLPASWREFANGTRNVIRQYQVSGKSYDEDDLFMDIHRENEIVKSRLAAESEIAFAMQVRVTHQQPSSKPKDSAGASGKTIEDCKRERLCFVCKQPGHIKPNCPVRIARAAKAAQENQNKTAKTTSTPGAATVLHRCPNSTNSFRLLLTCTVN